MKFLSSALSDMHTRRVSSDEKLPYWTPLAMPIAVGKRRVKRPPVFAPTLTIPITMEKGREKIGRVGGGEGRKIEITHIFWFVLAG